MLAASNQEVPEAVHELATKRGRSARGQGSGRGKEAGRGRKLQVRYSFSPYCQHLFPALCPGRQPSSAFGFSTCHEVIDTLINVCGRHCPVQARPYNSGVPCCAYLVEEACGRPVRLRSCTRFAHLGTSLACVSAGPSLLVISTILSTLVAQHLRLPHLRCAG